MDMYEKDFVFCIVGLDLFGHGDLCCESSRPAREMDWFGSWYGEVNGSAKLDGKQKHQCYFRRAEGSSRYGKLTYKLENGTGIVEGFAGAIGLDNKTLYFAEV